MNQIHLDGDALEERFDQQDRLTDALDRALNGFPGPVNGGAASDYIGVLFQSSIEGMSNLADTHRALIAVARDVANDLALTDNAGAQVFDDLSESL